MFRILGVILVISVMFVLSVSQWRFHIHLPHSHISHLQRLPTYIYILAFTMLFLCVSQLLFCLSRINDLERRIEEIERRVTASTQRCNTMEEKYKSTLQERDRLQASLKESGKELDALKAQLERVKRQLEDETVERVDLHNRIMSLNEEVAFIRKKHSAVCTHNITCFEWNC